MHQEGSQPEGRKPTDLSIPSRVRQCCLHCKKPQGCYIRAFVEVHGKETRGKARNSAAHGYTDPDEIRDEPRITTVPLVLGAWRRGRSPSLCAAESVWLVQS